MPANRETRTTAKKPSKRSPKAAKPVPKPVGVLEAPATGNGLLWRGKATNHVAGPGRPPNAMREAMRGRLDSVVLERWHREWEEGTVPTKDYAEFLAKYGLGVKDDHSAIYEMLFTQIKDLTLELLDKPTADKLLAAFHEAHRTLTEGR